MKATKKYRLVFLGFMLFFFFHAFTVFAQFTVVSTQPSHGATQVDTAGTLSISFNAPLDTSARFPHPEDFFLNLYLYPDTLVGDPDSITLSPDLQTVFVHNLHLAENTSYLIVVVDAVNQAGDSLDMPYSLMFSTGNFLPANSVAGTISYPSQNPMGSWVGLLDSEPFQEDGGEVVNGTIVQGSGGSYTIDFVEAGTYWPVAAKDFYIDEYGEPEFEEGSAIGFYDANQDHIVDSIQVTSGVPVVGVDIQLHTLVSQTSRVPFPAVQNAAQAWSPDAYLTGIYGTVEPDGTALIWQYLFYSPGLNDQTGWLVFGDLLVRVAMEDSLMDTLAVPQNWLDSDTILAITETNGGSDFRQNYPDAEVGVYLGYLSFDGEKVSFLSPGKTFDLMSFSMKKNSQTLAIGSLFDADGNFDTIMEPQPAVWMVAYESDSTGAELLFILDSQTGKILNQPTTAATAEPLAFSLAQNLAADVRLWTITSHIFSVDSLGKTDMWLYLYYSASLDTVVQVIFWGEIPVSTGFMGYSPPDTSSIPANWLNSDLAIAVAEANGGAVYRNSNQDVFVMAHLSRWFQGANPDLTVWEFRYTSSTAPEFIILVDAISGNVVGLESVEGNPLPEEYSLYQNYPNPFNPVTTIRYELPVSAHVKLQIFDLLGREVATLVDDNQPAGSYEIRWDAREYPSGLYFYHLVSGQFRETKKMLLIR
ncbi:MAG: hypothetical protein Kow0042_09320 [Calditrichia bacterium]